MPSDRVLCPNCERMVRPRLAPYGLQRRCPRCEEVLFDPTDPPRPAGRRPDRTARREAGPDRARRSGPPVMLIVGAVLIFVGVAAAGGLILALRLFGGRTPDPVPPVVVAGAGERAKPAADPAGRLPDQMVERVKAATVYIRVTLASPRGQAVASGSGFFAGGDGLIVTNAHVVSPPAELPGTRVRRVEVVVWSGEPRAVTLDAAVVRADRARDLALLRVAAAGLPDPLEVGDTAGLRETHDVYIFGFPLGEKLGKSITVSKSSVSSFRREPGRDEVQVNGGMHPGNSGGPVTDASGKVVGVAVAGIVGTQINFAIPGEAVQEFIRSAPAGDPVAALAPPAPPWDPPAAPAPPPLPVPGPPVIRAGPEPAGRPDLPAGTRATQIMGGAFDPEFHEAGPDGSLLAGLEVGLGKFFDNDVVKAVRPVFRKGDKETLGTQRGTELGRVVKVIAKPGYAVGAMTVQSGLGVDGLSVTFMKVVDGKLDPADSYKSEWVGGPGGHSRATLGGDGSAVVGIVGKGAPPNATGLGLLLGPRPAPAPEPPGLKDTRPEGGFFARNDYRDVQPDGAILVGFEVGLGRVFNTDIINYLRPIWVGPKGERLGIAYGKRPAKVETVRARDGYALGGVVVAGGGALEGVSFTFMRTRAGGGLDPNDSYASDWYGEQRRKPRDLRAKGEGWAVVGIHGKRFDDRDGNNYDDGGAIATIGLVLAPPRK